MLKRAHVSIYGDVIGVGFRVWAVRNAKELQLTGWVQNAGNGLVEALFEGEKEKIEEMIRCCKKGPDVAWVEKVEVKWGNVTNEFMVFEIRF